MPSACAACQAPFTKERRGLKCTLCDERRVAEPAYYCDHACQKKHWREHKAFHAQLEIRDQRRRECVRADVPEKNVWVDPAVTSEQFVSLLQQSDQARHRGEYREAVKRAKKAIALEPAQPDGYFFLATAYADSADLTNAMPQFLKIMELTDTGTLWNRQYGDEKWATAASSAFSCIGQCDAPKPDWFTDPQQLKRTADRAVAALPDDFAALQMRIRAYRYTPMETAPVDDLRQVLRDVRRLLAALNEGKPAFEHFSKRAASFEEELRKRIAADLAALKLADD